MRAATTGLCRANRQRGAGPELPLQLGPVNTQVCLRGQLVRWPGLLLQAVLWACASLLAGPGASAQQTVPTAESQAARHWTALAAQGQALYFGQRSFQQPARVLGAPLPARDSACLRCHGANGQGSAEAGAVAPDVRAAALVARGLRGSGAALQAALTGHSANGRELDAGMPRYALQPDELSALLEFWPWLGHEGQMVRGVSADTVRLGVVLNGLEPAAARAEVLAGMASVLDHTNARGGVHGRQLQLLPFEITGSGPVEHDVFALLGSALPPGLRERLPALRLPSLASLGWSRFDATASDWELPLVPSLRQQAQQAVQRLNVTPGNCLRWVHDPAGILDTAKPSGADAVGPSGPRPAAGQSLCVAALMPSQRVDELRALWAAEGIELSQLVELSGWRHEPLTVSGLAHELVLPLPRAVGLHALQQQQSVWRSLGQAAARVAVEALARSGRVLQAETVLAQMRHLTGFEPLPGAAVAWSPHQFHGWMPELLLPIADAPVQTAHRRVP